MIVLKIVACGLLTVGAVLIFLALIWAGQHRHWKKELARREYNLRDKSRQDDGVDEAATYTTLWGKRFRRFKWSGIGFLVFGATLLIVALSNDYLQQLVVRS